MTVSLSCEMLMWQCVFLSCLLGTEKLDNEGFFLLTCRRCQSCGKCFLENFRWVFILTTPTMAWQGTLTVLWWRCLTFAHAFGLFAVCASIPFSVAPTAWTVPGSLNSNYLFCSLTQMWQFEVEAIARVGKLHTVETICPETRNY